MEAAEKLIQAKIEEHLLAKLPSHERCLPLSQAILEMRQLKQLPILQRASVASVGLVDGVIEVLVGMERGISPDPMYKGTGEFLNTVWARLENFARFCKVPSAGSAADAPPKEYIGMAAIGEMFLDLEHRMAADASRVGFSDLNELQRFKWLLTSEQSQALHAWTNQILEGMAKEGKSHLPAAASTSSKKKRQQQKQQQQPAFDDDKTRVMSFFG